MDQSVFVGLSFVNLRKALFLLFFGTRDGECNNFNSPLYKYIIPMQGNFENPLVGENAKDTFMLYWIESDESLSQDDYYTDPNTNIAYNRQKCVASVLVRFIGKEAETWAKTFRHMCKREDAQQIFYRVCNGERMVQTSPIIPFRINYSGKNSEIAFDVRFKIYYDELIATGWEPLEGIDFATKAEIVVEK